MRNNDENLIALVAAIAALLILAWNVTQIQADDWPQWRGPRRDGVSLETGLMQTWPEGGPKVAWQAAGLGGGYSSVIVGQGRLITMGRRESDVVVTALDEATGTTLWARKIGQTTRNACSTPTLDGDLLYALDPDGDLVCLAAATGDVVWRTSFIEKFSGRMMSGRGYGESPLVDGQQLICTPGGADAALVALDKLTGHVIWKAVLPELGPRGKDGAGFSSIVVTEAAGLRQYVQLVGRGIVGIDARDGRFLWGFNKIANETANIPTPVVHNEYVFAANGYTAGSVLLKLVADRDQNGANQGVKAEAVYTLAGNQFQNHHGGFVRLGDYLFSGHGNNNGLPTCLDFNSGRVIWKRRGPGVGSASVVAADGRLYFRYQNGVVALIDATTRGYELQGTFEIPGAGGDSWAHPVVANGRLYLREQDSVWACDLRKDAQLAEPAPSQPSLTSNATLAALRQLGVSIEQFSSVSISSPIKSRRIYDQAMAGTDSRPQTTLLVTITDSQLSPEGDLSPELVELLREVQNPMIASLAGTRVSDQALAQLQPLGIVGLNLELCNGVTDAGMKHLRQATQLRVLVLAGTGITHVGIEQLAMSKSLVALDLELCDGIHDDACDALGNMQQLQWLGLKKSGFEPLRITDTGLTRLKNLTELRVLNLYGNKITDTGLAHLQPFTKLNDLNLSLLPITDEGLKYLTSLTALEHLELLYSEGFAGPKLTDGLVDSLVQLSKLTSLNLTGAKLTDAGLVRLRGLKELRILRLVRTQISDEGVREFRNAATNCEVIKS